MSFLFRSAAGAARSTSPLPLIHLSTPKHSVTVSAAGVVLRRFTADDAVLTALHASFSGDGPDAASLVVLHGGGRTLSVVGPGGAVSRVPLPAPAARVWALGPDKGVLCAGDGSGAVFVVSHPLDAPDPVVGFSADAGPLVWASPRDSLALTAPEGCVIALWSLRLADKADAGLAAAPPPAATAAGTPATPLSTGTQR